MTAEDLESLKATLKRLTAPKDADAEANRKALMVAVQGVQTALAELLAANEKAEDGAEEKAIADAAERIVQAIGGITLDVPPMEFQPNINVAAPNVTVQAPEVTVQAPAAPVNQITVLPAPPVALPPRPVRYEVETKLDRYGAPTGRMVITPIYS